jgi:hypothetical protein
MRFPSSSQSSALHRLDDPLNWMLTAEAGTLSVWSR